VQDGVGCERYGDIATVSPLSDFFVVGIVLFPMQIDFPHQKNRSNGDYYADTSENVHSRGRRHRIFVSSFMVSKAKLARSTIACP
jgi:hypothetical protein